MANNPHVSLLSSSLSTSPYAVQSNLEQLINRSRTHPHPRRPSDVADQPHPRHLVAHASPHMPAHPPNLISSHDIPPLVTAEPAAVPSPRRGSAYAHTFEVPRIGTIREASYDDGAAIMFGDEADEETERDERDERSTLLGSRREPRRQSYGATSEPIAWKADKIERAGRRRSDAHRPAGTSRSRSKARTPPRREPLPHTSTTDTTSTIQDETDDNEEDDFPKDFERGRGTDERPLSPVSTKYSGDGFRRRRESVTTRFADDSSGDEGGDVARGLAATGGGAVFGGRVGMGMLPGGTSGGVGVMDLDPAEELDAEDLELPLADDGREVREWPEALRTEMAVILRTAGTVFFTQLAEWSLVLASVVSIGHLGTTELAASSLASMTASVSSFSILQGLATALDTLLPAAWTSSDPSRVGLWTQRAGVVIAVAMIPMFVLWWNVYGVLIALGQEPDVAAKASLYLRYLSFGIPGYGGNLIIKKYLQAQGLVNIPTYVLFIVSPLNLVFNYLFVWGPQSLRLGFVGGAVATSLSYTLTFILSTTWAVFYGPREAFHPLTFKSTFSKLGTVTSLGLAGTIMLSSEWWAWEAAALAASLLGPVNLAAQSVLLSTASTFYQVPASLGVSSAVRVGNLLGAGRGWEAKWASRASLFLSVAFGVLNSVICLVFRKNWGYLFNSDPEVVAVVARVLPYIALFQITDGITAATGAVLRSLGLHTTGALINLTSYYIIGLPAGLWLTFTPRFNLGLVGLWIGLSVALGYGSVVSGILVWRANWTRAVERVRERLGLNAKGEVGEDGKWEDAEGRGLLEDEEEEDEDHVRV